MFDAGDVYLVKVFVLSSLFDLPAMAEATGLVRGHTHEHHATCMSALAMLQQLSVIAIVKYSLVCACL
jgi:hypothetical protein